MAAKLTYAEDIVASSNVTFSPVTINLVLTAPDNWKDFSSLS